MTAPPLELRMYMRRVTLDELEAGVNPIRQNGKLFHPAVLQWRVRNKDGWSEWFEVGYAREE